MGTKIIKKSIDGYCEGKTTWSILYQDGDKYYLWKRWADCECEHIDAPENISLEEAKFGKLYELCEESNMDKIVRYLEEEHGLAIDSLKRKRINDILLNCNDFSHPDEKIEEFLTRITDEKDWDTFYKDLSEVVRYYDDDLCWWVEEADEFINDDKNADTEEKKLFTEMWKNDTFHGEQCEVYPHVGCESLSSYVLNGKTCRATLDENGDKKVELFIPTIYYNSKEGQQMTELESLIKKHNGECSDGISCLIYGEPDTGKYMSVHQLARRSGRPLISARWCWQSYCSDPETIEWLCNGGGKSFFNAYHTQYKDNDAPILFLDHIDSLLKDCPQRDTIQELLRQELEHFNGILIATATQPDCIDEDLLQLFNHKICLEKPNTETREMIWHNRVPVLTEQEVKRFAEHELDGRQIANICDHFSWLTVELSNIYKYLYTIVEETINPPDPNSVVDLPF